MDLLDTGVLLQSSDRLDELVPVMMMVSDVRALDADTWCVGSGHSDCGGNTRSRLSSSGTVRRLGAAGTQLRLRCNLSSIFYVIALCSAMAKC